MVGAWNTFFGYVIFLLLDSVFSLLFSKRYLAYMFAITIANIISIMNAFVFHKYVTFRSHVSGMSRVSEFLKFCTTYLFSLFLTLTVLPILVELLHIHPKVGAALTIPIVTVISYLGHSRFSFKGNN